MDRHVIFEGNSIACVHHRLHDPREDTRVDRNIRAIQTRSRRSNSHGMPEKRSVDVEQLKCNSSGVDPEPVVTQVLDSIMEL